MMLSQKHLFNLPEEITYLNCAYMSPLMKHIKAAGIAGMEAKQRPFQVTVNDFFEPPEELRKVYSQLINCSDPRQVVVIPSVSYGIATIAANLNIPTGSNIIIAGEQFPSNVYSWTQIAKTHGAKVNVIDPPLENEERGRHWNEKILAAIDSSTSLVAISHCHWADGTRFDLKALRAKTNEVGAALVIDGTQSVGALPFNVEDIKPDALICAGYKWLMGPYSMGLAYYDPKYNDGIPIEDNWINRNNSENFSGLIDYEDSYQPGALRYEVGEHSNFILIPMQLEAIRQIQEWGIANIQEYCKSISQDCIKQLQSEGFWIEEEAYRGTHLFGIRLTEGVSIDRIKAKLDENKIFVSIRGTSIRVAPHVYNTSEDLDKLATVLLEEIKVRI